MVAIYSVFMKISIHYYAPLVRFARVHNIRRVTEKIFVVSGYHCSLWPKVTRVERFLKLVVAILIVRASDINATDQILVHGQVRSILHTY